MYRLLSSEHRAAGHSKIVLDKTDFKLKNTIVFLYSLINQFQTFSHFLDYTFNYNKVDHALLDGFWQNLALSGFTWLLVFFLSIFSSSFSMGILGPNFNGLGLHQELILTAPNEGGKAHRIFIDSAFLHTLNI